jgi:hypothetical protein
MVNNTLSKNNQQDYLFFLKAWIYLESAFQWRRLEQLPLEVVVPVAVNRERRRDLEFQWWWETWKKNWGLGSWLDAREEETEGLQTLATFCLRFFFYYYSRSHGWFVRLWSVGLSRVNILLGSISNRT